MGTRRLALLVVAVLPLLSGCEPSVIAEAKESVKRSARDPESAQFRDVSLCHKPKAVRGDVNLKNGQGGYTGFTPFIYVEEVGSVVLDEEADFGLWDELRKKCWSDAIIRDADAEEAKFLDTLPELEPTTAPEPDPTPKPPVAGPISMAKPDRDHALEPQDLCWQDYCPCEPPQGGPDQGLCRMLRAGTHVDDELLAAGAMFRDSRRQLVELEAEHGAFDE